MGILKTHYDNRHDVFVNYQYCRDFALEILFNVKKVMYEPLTFTAGATAASAGITFASLFPEATPAVVLCSLSGAALYVLSAHSHRLCRQIMFALISFVGGIYCADTASEIIAVVINAGLRHFAPGALAGVHPLSQHQYPLAVTVPVTLLSPCRR